MAAILDKLVTIYRRLEIYLANIGWIMVNKLLAMALKFAITIAVARYLGPQQFGLLAYVLSLTALFAVLGHVGLGGLVVRDLVVRPERSGETLGAAFLLKCVGAWLGYVALVFYALCYEGFGTDIFWLVIVVGLIVPLTPFRVMDLWFDAHLKARYVTLSSLAGLVVAAVAKLLLMHNGFGIFSIAAADLLQALVAIVLLTALFLSRSTLSISDLRFSRSRALDLFRSGWAVYLGAFFAVVYLKVDQVMLRWLSGMEDVGQYAVAAQLSEAWYFLPAAIATSVFPALIETRKSDRELFERRFQQLLDILFSIALLVAVIASVFAGLIVQVFFGEQYSESASILTIHVWAGLFIFMRAAFSKWILIEDVLIFSLVTQGMGAIINIALNIPLIVLYGAQGAAFATLVSYAAASFLALYLHARTRPVFRMMLKAMASPIRYPYYMAANRIWREKDPAKKA